MFSGHSSALRCAHTLAPLSQEQQVRALEDVARVHNVYKAFSIAHFVGDPWVLQTLKSRLKDKHYQELVDARRLRQLP
ncbi:MAG: hypothetical protein UY09_C0040G0002 [Parcubacteria group bacterium GW2011_GWA2_47_8]|nr:MAG: hypothetical protein UY09_C0040G0002 [Parcubacteria group bacterium GW2011_GWA2_47_8]OHB20831.1 MAG: hypothetical protein A2666_04755 [Parcubacteria group bacterium RIFCSPHIGHO2_01_FULL_47_10b]